MERNERLKAADKCASIYTDENEVRIARKAFMLGCEFEAQGKIIKGVVLDTKDEQPSEYLEEEIKRYLREECSGDDEPAVSEIASHFANWQKEQMIRDCSVQASYEAEIEKAEERGYNLCKEQMMKDAVEGEVCKDDGDVWIELSPYAMPHFKDMQPVKVIVIKED